MIETKIFTIAKTKTSWPYKACQINFSSNCNACFVYSLINYDSFKDQDDLCVIFLLLFVLHALLKDSQESTTPIYHDEQIKNVNRRYNTKDN